MTETSRTVRQQGSALSHVRRTSRPRFGADQVPSPRLNTDTCEQRQDINLIQSHVMSSVRSTDSPTNLQPVTISTMSFHTTIPFDHLEYQWRLVRDHEHLVPLLTGAFIVALTWFLYNVSMDHSASKNPRFTRSRSRMPLIYPISRESPRYLEQSLYLDTCSSLATITPQCARNGGGSTSIPSSRSNWATHEQLS